MKTEAVEAAVAASASKATYGGAATMGVGWLMSNEFAVLAGLVLGFAGFVVNLYFRRRQDRRDEREHALRIAAIEREARATRTGCRGACRHN